MIFSTSASSSVQRSFAATGSSRNAILSVIGFFAVGAVLLALVNVESGQRVAREVERELEQAAY